MPVLGIMGRVPGSYRIMRHYFGELLRNQGGRNSSETAEKTINEAVQMMDLDS